MVVVNIARFEGHLQGQLNWLLLFTGLLPLQKTSRSCRQRPGIPMATERKTPNMSTGGRPDFGGSFLGFIKGTELFSTDYGRRLTKVVQHFETIRRSYQVLENNNKTKNGEEEMYTVEENSRGRWRHRQLDTYLTHTITMRGPCKGVRRPGGPSELICLVVVSQINNNF